MRVAGGSVHDVAGFLVAGVAEVLTGSEAASYVAFMVGMIALVGTVGFTQRWRSETQDDDVFSPSVLIGVSVVALSVTVLVSLLEACGLA